MILESDVNMSCTSKYSVFILTVDFSFAAKSPYQIAVTINYKEPLLLDSIVALTCSVFPDPPEGLSLIWRDFIPYMSPQPRTADAKGTNATLQLKLGHPSSARYFCNVDQYGTLLASGSVNVNANGNQYYIIYI